MAEWLLAQLLAQGEVAIYVVIFALLLCGALGFPPEDLTLILSGIVLNHGKVDPQTLFIVCYIGTILGDIFIYAVGRWFGKTLFQKEWFKRRVRKARLRQMRNGLERRHFLMVFFARHLFYLRTVTFLTCGALHTSFLRFIAADCLSAVVSVPLMLCLGYLAAEHYDTVMRYIGHAKAISLFIVLAVAAFALWLLYGRQKPPESEVSEEKI
jgi:membrane protein DedA with SNARE-associated domain